MGDVNVTIRDVLEAHGRLLVSLSNLSDDDDLFENGMTSHASVNVMLAIEDAFDVEFPKTAFKNRWLTPGASDDARAHLDARRLVAIIVTMKLEAALTANQGPIVALRRPLVEIVDRSTEVVEASRPARNQEGRRRHVPHQIFQLYPLEDRKNGRQIGIAKNVADEIEKLRRLGRCHLYDCEHERARMVNEIDVVIFPFANEGPVSADAMLLRQRR